MVQITDTLKDGQICFDAPNDGSGSVNNCNGPRPVVQT
jgi:hypothetical protein